MATISLEPYVPSRFTVNLLLLARLPSPDWDRILTSLTNYPQAADYFTAAQRKCVDDSGKSLLHYACAMPKRKEALETVQKLFKYCDAFQMKKQNVIDFVNLMSTTPDNKGITALQIATENRNLSLVKLLIERGADIYLLKMQNLEAVQMIYDNVLIKIFDASIEIVKDDEDMENNAVWEIDCDFGPINGWHNKSSEELGEDKTLINQTRHLARVLRQEKATRDAILTHALVQIFLHIKWRKFAWLLYTSMIYHIIWSLISFAFIFCNTHILESTNIEETSRDSNLTVFCQRFRIYRSDSTSVGGYSAYFYIMVLLYIFAVGKEIVELVICEDRWYYWKQLENLGQWWVTTTMFIVWLVALINRAAGINEDEYYQSFIEESTFLWKNALPLVYITGMFASLLLIQGQLTKTSLLGVYNEMFVKGFLNIIKFLLAFLPLLVAFMMTFHVLLPMRREFLPSWGLGFAKILAMMTGEVGYDDVTYGDDEEEIAFKNTLKVLLLVFIVTVVILLQNLLIGMTVDDVQKLEAKAKVNSLACTLEDIYLMENLVVHPLTVQMFRKLGKVDLYRKWVIVTKADTEYEGTEKNKRLDEYPEEIREALENLDRKMQSSSKQIS